MTHFIHPTAILGPDVRLGDQCHIGPYCVLSGAVTLGDRVTLKSHVIIEGETRIGDDTVVHPFASLGTAPQDLKYKDEPTRLEIGDRNIIREHATLNRGTAQGGGVTRVGNDNLLMIGVHLAHDCSIGNSTVIANYGLLAGHVVVGDGAVIGGHCGVHQFVRIGEGAVIGGMTGVDTDIIPYGRVKGERGTLEGLNITGLERHGADKETLRDLQRAFNELFYGEGTFDERVERTGTQFASNDRVARIIAFVRAKSRFPICQPARKAA